MDNIGISSNLIFGEVKGLDVVATETGSDLLLELSVNQSFVDRQVPSRVFPSQILGLNEAQDQTIQSIYSHVGILPDRGSQSRAMLGDLA